MERNQPITLAGTTIQPGEQKQLDIPAANFYTHSPLHIPVHVIHGKYKGPRLFVIAAIHGDEINGVEVIKRLLKKKLLKQINGTLIAIPIANIYGFINLSRYLPDRRDLNRVFPGSKKGSLAARLAYLYMQEIIKYCTHGIDLHTGTIHRTNLPQLRVNLATQGVEPLAKAFGVPVIINADTRDGSLRQACCELNIPLLVYEAGEALRFDEAGIRMGINGIINVMRKLEMLPPYDYKKSIILKSTVARSSLWIRATASGIVQATKRLGQLVNENDVLGTIVDPFGNEKTQVTSSVEGIIIGKNNLPLVNEGDALFHIASFKELERVSSQIDELELLDSNRLIVG